MQQDLSALQVMQQTNTAMAHNTMSYVRQAPQQFSRSFQPSPPKAAVNRSMASVQNMRASSSQQMAPLSLGQQYFTHVEVKLCALLHSSTWYICLCMIAAYAELHTRHSCMQCDGTGMGMLAQFRHSSVLDCTKLEHMWCLSIQQSCIYSFLLAL